MISVCIVHESGWSVSQRLAFLHPLFLFLRDFVSHFKLNLSGAKITSELVQWAYVLFVSLTPPGVTPESFHLILRVLDSASGNLRPPWLLMFLNGQFCVTPGGASILINEWVSLQDHCTAGGLGLHHTHKFLSHLRKLKQAGSLVPFLWILLTFILTNSVMAVKLRKSVRSASYLTTQPRPFSPLQWSNLGIFQLGPRYSSIFFPTEPLPAQYLPTGWQLPWHLSVSHLPPPTPDTQDLMTGQEYLGIFQPSSAECLDHK